ncbi:MAG TPA: acetyl-CoA carboxylase biotin carboxyl carrier protein [Firmicutes bacterium]|nr:acetyl-CoA carboxylase biotin carboxyl carrier protein [Bacillota bacterium]
MNIKEIKELVKMLDGTDITEFSMENEGSKVVIKKGISGQMPVIPQMGSYQYPVITQLPASSPTTPQETSSVEDKSEGLGPNQVLIVAPMVGTFYRSSSPEAEPYAQINQMVEAGQVVCIIEAMKLMNEIESEWKGKIVEILVDNAHPVEYGQPLMVLEKV